MIDPSGSSGRYLGRQIEGAVRYDLLPGNLRVEVGAAYLFQGSFARDAPNANGNGDPAYFYVQATLTF